MSTRDMLLSLLTIAAIVSAAVGYATGWRVGLIAMAILSAGIGWICWKSNRFKWSQPD